MIPFKYLVLPLFLVLVFPATLSAQVNADTTLRNLDSCELLRNRSENILSIRSQIVTINANTLSAGSSLNILNALSGKMSGVDIRTATSGNSASSTFFIRGERNLITDNQPLFIVDGFPITRQLNSILGFDFGNMVNDWNLDDIESVTILKGGQAASLFGDKSGNSVVIIQTKKASTTGFHVDYSTSFLMRKIADYPEFQNSYGQGYNGEFTYVDGVGGGMYDESDGSWGPRLNGQLITQFDGPSTGFINGQVQQVRGGDTWSRQQADIYGIDNKIEPTPWVAQPDNLKDYFQPSFTLANNLALSWASSQGGLRLAYTNVWADDVTPNTRLLKNTLNGNFNYSVFKRVKLFGSFQNTKLNEKNVIISADPFQDNPMLFFTWMGRQVNTNSLKRYWQAGQENNEQFNYVGNYANNPWFTAFENDAPIVRKNFFGTYGVKFELAKGISLSYTGGFNKIDASADKNVAQGSFPGYPVYTKNEELMQSVSRHSFLADYNLTLSQKHCFNAFGGLYLENKKGHELYTLSKGIYGETITNPNTNGYFGGLSYIGNNAFSARVTFSQDISKLIGKISTPVFYSVSAGVEINRIVHLPKFISTLSVQSGYSSRGLNEMHIQNFSGFPPGQNSYSTVGEYTLSADMGIFNNRISWHGNYYNSRTHNGLLFVSVATNSGYESKVVNTASVKNTGYELSLDIIPVQSPAINWKVSVLYFKNKNEVIELANGNSLRHFSENVEMFSEKGQPMGNLYGSKYKRHDGQVIYKNGLPQTSNRSELLGNVNPDYMIFITNSLSVYKFLVSVNIEYSKGGIYYSSFYSNGTVAGTLANTANREDGVVGEGVKWDEATDSYIQNDVNVLAQKYFVHLYRIDEYSIMDATYVKLKEINIAYSFTLKQNLRMTCSIFGQNLITWSGGKDYQNGNLFYYNNMYYKGLNSFNLPETYGLGMKIQLHI
jgi:hypothetical protein